MLAIVAAVIFATAFIIRVTRTARAGPARGSRFAARPDRGDATAPPTCLSLHDHPADQRGSRLRSRTSGHLCSYSARACPVRRAGGPIQVPHDLASVRVVSRADGRVRSA